MDRKIKKRYKEGVLLTNFNNRKRLEFIEDMNKKRENLVNFGQKFNSSVVESINKDRKNLVDFAQKYDSSMIDEFRKTLFKSHEIREALSKSVTGDIYQKLNVAKALNKQSLDIGEIVSMARTLNSLNFSADTKRMVSFVESLNKKGLLDINKIISLGESLDLSSYDFNKVNWRDFSLNNDTFKQVSETLESEEDLEESIKNVDFNKIENPKYNFVNFIFCVLQFISSTAGAANDTMSAANGAIDLLENYQEYKQEYIVESNESDIEDINIEDSFLKQIENKIRVVTKQDLVVREGKRQGSRIVGKLDVGNIVQILEKKKNWVYVSYVNRENGEISGVVEVWTLTRYVKRIK